MIRPAALVALVLTQAAGANAQAAQASLSDIRAFLEIDDRLATGGQITEAQLPTLRDAGYEVVLNLATPDAERFPMEAFSVTSLGMTYLQVPVNWGQPTERDLDQFFRLMDANQDRKVFVHCVANYRVSAFLYLYRTVHLGEDEAAARADLAKIWDPASEPTWQAFIDQVRAEAAGTPPSARP